jgi:hypothetical protein
MVDFDLAKDLLEGRFNRFTIRTVYVLVSCSIRTSCRCASVFVVCFPYFLVSLYHISRVVS